MRSLRTLQKMTAVTFEVEPGSSIKACIHDAIRYSRVGSGSDDYDRGMLVSFELDGITVSVKSDSDPSQIYQDWSRAKDDKTTKYVGPYATPVISDERRTSATQAPPIDAPVMEIVNERAWQSYQVSHRSDEKKGIVDLAERWARLIQKALDEGTKLSDVAGPLFEQANTADVSSSGQEVVVTILANCWKHGERLRRWHSTQQGSSSITVRAS